jgi:hypothetical protein
VNPQVEKRLELVHARIDQLRQVLAQASATIADNATERQAMREEQFRQRKEIVTLEHKGREFDVIQGQNERLSVQQADLHQRVRTALSTTRALAQELRQK